MPLGERIKQGSHKKDKKQVGQSNLRASQEEKKRRQGQKLLNLRREEATRDAEGTTYERGAFND